MENKTTLAFYAALLFLAVLAGGWLPAAASPEWITQIEHWGWKFYLITFLCLFAGIRLLLAYMPEEMTPD